MGGVRRIGGLCWQRGGHWRGWWGETMSLPDSLGLRTVLPGADAGLTDLLEVGEERQGFLGVFCGPGNGEVGGGRALNQL